MYAFLSRHLPRFMAIPLSILWYTGLILGILILLYFVPQSPFRYEMI